MNLNKVFLIGNLTRDPELKQIPSGQAVCTFGIATNRVFTNAAGQKQEQVEFHNIVAWGRQAEVIAQYMKRGSMIFVEGRLQTRNWQDQQGAKHYRTEIVIEQFQFGPKMQGGDGINQRQGGGKFDQNQDGVQSSQTPPRRKSSSCAR